MKTLNRRQDPLANPAHQIDVLNQAGDEARKLEKFSAKLEASGLFPLMPKGLETLQINLGKLCNQTCKHCHVDAGPDRTEVMSRETMQHCLQAVREAKIRQADLTGGAPEMNPHFRWFVEELVAAGCDVIVRCNLTILTAGQAYADLPQFFAQHKVRVVSSLPYYSKNNTDRQRGMGVFDKSIEALHRLNAVGYGRPGSGLTLDLVYNPAGAFLPADQKALEADFKRELKKLFGIEFSTLLTITNLPVSRFLEYLVESDNLESYLTKLVQAYNPAAAAGVMCRSLLSVGWDGQLYDCDFNQMLELGVQSPIRHISQFSAPELLKRAIVVNQHCYGCTAGQGSSCGGQTA